jgi:hypothetical protein
MNEGDKIQYTYTHSLNGKSKTQITKKGVFIRWIYTRHPYRKKTDFCLVQLTGNKNPVKKHRSEIKIINR